MAEVRTEILAPRSGYIKMFDNTKIGLLLIELGGGRKSKEDKIDHAVGFRFHKKIGDKVKKGESIFTIIHHPHQTSIVETIKTRFLKEVLTMSSLKVKYPKLILEKIG
jgi:pyrimidine-nucleoside phosphorylase